MKMITSFSGNRRLLIGLVASLLPGLTACTHSLIRVNTSGQTVTSVPAGTSISSTRIQASTESRLGAAIIIAVLLVEGLRYFRVEPDGTRTPVDAATAERLGVSHQVSVQDCTQPVDLTAGNLICR